MCRDVLHLSGVFLLVTLFAVGCTSVNVNYVGHSLDSTTTVDVYNSKGDIEKPYTVIGHAVGSGVLASENEMKATLIVEAQRRGADAILIIGPDTSEAVVEEIIIQTVDELVETVDELVDEYTEAKVKEWMESELKASFLKYK